MFDKQPVMETLHLFRPEIAHFPVHTRRLGIVPYVNFDHAATTPPLRSVERAVENFMSCYGSVHRGAGEKSKASDKAMASSGLPHSNT